MSPAHILYAIVLTIGLLVPAQAGTPTPYNRSELIAKIRETAGRFGWPIDLPDASKFSCGEMDDDYRTCVLKELEWFSLNLYERPLSDSAKDVANFRFGRTAGVSEVIIRLYTNLNSSQRAREILFATCASAYAVMQAVPGREAYSGVMRAVEGATAKIENGIGRADVEGEPASLHVVVYVKSAFECTITTVKSTDEEE